MPGSQATGLRVGRIVTDRERVARIANEAAFSIDNEMLRSAFAISDRHILTAWHCVRELMVSHEKLWFRIRNDALHYRRYSYIPMRVSNYDTTFDAAVLALDEHRLYESGLKASTATQILASAAIPLGLDPQVNDRTQVIGFPASGTTADSDTNHADIVDTALPLGDVVGLKLFGPAFAAISPVDPHGLSGGPVVRESHLPGRRSHEAIGVVRAVPQGLMPRAAAGGCVVATRIEDVVGTLPEVALAISACHQSESAVKRLAASRGNNLLAVLHACRSALRDGVAEVTDPALGRLVGWVHFFDEPPAHRRPTAISTAYGLKLALILDEPDGRLDRSALAETLWKLRLADGGWAARTGSAIGRPEVSALVLGALSSAGYDPDRLAEAGAMFEQALSPGTDLAATERTYVLTAVLRGLMRVLPTSHRLAELRAELLAGAIRDPGRGNLLCWSVRLKPNSDLLPSPSVAHTAMAVVALARVGELLGEDVSARSAMQEAVRWLASRRRMSGQTEQIRRYVRDDHPWESLTVSHFTAAWVARALLAAPHAEVPEADSLLADAVEQVWRAQRDGVWHWQDGDRPVWMTYQGASVLREYAWRLGAPS